MSQAIGNLPQEPYQSCSCFVLTDLPFISFIDAFGLQSIPILICIFQFLLQHRLWYLSL